MRLVDEKEIAEVMNEVVENYLKPRFIELGMNASGDWLRSLEVHTGENTGEIWGLDYTEYLAEGREPGKRPPIDPLIRWVQFKFGQSGEQARSTAFAVANKIAKEGTRYYPQGTDLLDLLKSPEVVGYVTKRIGEKANAKIMTDLLNRLKDAT